VTIIKQWEDQEIPSSPVSSYCIALKPSDSCTGSDAVFASPRRHVEY